VVRYQILKLTRFYTQCQNNVYSNVLCVPNSFNHLRQKGYVLASVCLFVCLMDVGTNFPKLFQKGQAMGRKTVN